MFLKQLPGSLSLVSASLLSAAAAAAIGCPPNNYGAFISLKYHVIDRRGNVMAVPNMLPLETITEYIFDFVYQGDPYPNPVNFTNNVGTVADGTLFDAPFGQCATVQFISSDIQTITMQIGASRYTVRVNNWQYRSSTPGGGSITNNNDVNLSK
jgi:hypothetical protein